MNTQDRMTVFDSALDQRDWESRDPNIVDSELTGLLATAVTLQARYAGERVEPDVAFVEGLQTRLLASSPVDFQATREMPVGSRRWSIPGVPGIVASWRRPWGGLAIAASGVLLVAVAGVAALLLWRSLDQESARTIVAPTVSNEMASLDSADSSSPGFLWQVPLGNGDASSPPQTLTVYGDTVYRFITEGTDAYNIEAVDARAGEARWRVPAYVTGSMIADAFGVYYVSSGEATREGSTNSFIALDRSTGEERWQLDIDPYPISLSTADGRLYVSHQRLKTTAIDTRVGEIIWTQGEMSEGSSCAMFGSADNAFPAILDGAVAVSDCTGAVIGLNPENGKEMWRSTGYHSGGVLLTPAGDTLVVMSAYRWSGMGESEPATGDDNMSSLTAYPIAEYRIVALSATDGSVLWERYVLSKPVYAAVTDSTYAVIGAEVDGDVVDLIEIPGTPTGEGNEEFAYPGIENHVMGFDLHSGELVWQEEIEDGVYWWLSAWNSEGGSGIAATTSNSDIVPVGPWEGAVIVDPGESFLVRQSPLASDFGFVAETMDGRLVGIGVERDRP